MDGSEYLIVIAEIAVAFAGFTSIVAVFQQRRKDWSALQAHRINVMLQYGLLGVALALLPMPLVAIGVAEKDVWRLSNGLAGVLNLGHATVFVIPKYRRLAREGALGIRPGLMKASTVVGYALIAVVLLTAAGLVPLDQRGVYFVLLLWLLSMSGMMFALLVTTVSEPERTADPRSTKGEDASTR
ncbi:MAG TPA: hypothetical protein VK858_21705 [Longimicrobiales bacterium]|nr:hypothetical protein [Longimicrobiales bacterium]